MSQRVKWRDLANYEFLLPPKDQQAQLAELLWAMDEVIEREKEVLERLNTQLKVIESKYFNHKCNNKLKDIVKNTISGGTPNTKNEEYYSNGEVPWITTKILDSDFIGIGEKLITKEAIAKSAAKILAKGNIIAGTRVGVGKFAINTVDISFSQDINGLLIYHDIADAEFLIYQLNSNVFQKRIKPLLRGTTIKGILKDDLLNLSIFLPNKDDQVIIREDFKSIKKAFADVISNISTSKALQKSLINQIF
jgi:type I restriction enzyme S subunit